MGSAPESREGHEASLPTPAVSSMLPKSHGVQIFPLSGLLPANQTAGVQDRGLREAHWMRPRAYRHRLGDPSCWLLNPLPRLKPPSFDLGLGGQRGQSHSEQKSNHNSAGRLQVSPDKRQEASEGRHPGTAGEKVLESPWTPGWALGPNRHSGPVGGALPHCVQGPLQLQEEGPARVRAHQAPHSRDGQDHRTPTPGPWQWGWGMERCSPQAPHGTPAVSGSTSGPAVGSHLAQQHQRHRKHPGNADLGLPRWQES